MKTITIPGNNNSLIYSLILSKDETLLIAGGDDKIVRIIDLESNDNNILRTYNHNAVIY